jgi:hypothetical protein
MAMNQAGIWAKRLWPFGLLMAAIFISSSTVVTSKQFVKGIADYSPIRVTEAQFSEFWFQWWWMFVKGWHATEFALVFLAVRHAVGREKTGLAVAITAILAASDEIHQMSIPARGARITDWLIDLLGVTFLVAWFDLGRRRPETSVGSRLGLIAVLGFGLVLILRWLALHPYP